MDYGLNGKTIIVTGGASGIGAALCRLLAGEGANVVIQDMNGNAADALAVELGGEGSNILAQPVDVRDGDAVRAATMSCVDRFGPVWGLAACAGTGGARRAEHLDTAEMDAVMAVNLNGALVCAQAAAATMFDQHAGSIVIVGSATSFGAFPGHMHYSCSKAAVLALVQGLAAEWGHRGLRINGVAPNAVDTAMVQVGLPASFRKIIEDRTPLGRIGRPEEIAAAIAFLLSPAASYISGIMMPVDGGLMAGPYIHCNGRDLASNRLLGEGVYSEDEAAL